MVLYSMLVAVANSLLPFWCANLPHRPVNVFSFCFLAIKWNRIRFGFFGRLFCVCVCTLCLTSVSDLTSFPSSCSCVLLLAEPFRSVHSLLPFLAVVLGGLWFSYLLWNFGNSKKFKKFVVCCVDQDVGLVSLIFGCVCVCAWMSNIEWKIKTNLDCGDARSVCGVSASVGAVDDALLVGRRLFTGLAFSALPFEPSRSTLCRVSWSNELRKCRFLGASNVSGRLYICGIYGVKPLKPELLGFINESHSCFKLFNGTLADGDVPDELFLWCRRFISNCASCDCDCAAANRPCSVDKPLTCNTMKMKRNQKQKTENETKNN